MNTNRNFLLERDLGLVRLESVNNEWSSSRVRVREQFFAKFEDNCKLVREVREQFANSSRTESCNAQNENILVIKFHFVLQKGIAFT